MAKLTALLILAVLTACGRPGSEPASTGDQRTDALIRKTFRSVAVTEDGKPRPLVVGTRIELRFETGGTFAVSAGCNRISGSVEVEGDRLRFGDLLTTDMGCDEPRMAQDGWLSGFLREQPTWRLTDGELVLSTDRTQIRLAPQPTLPVVGSRWVVTSLVSGESASSLPAGVEASLTFDGQRVTGSTGCNRLSGPATLARDRVVFGPIVTTRMACGGGAGVVERAVLAVLNAGTVDLAVDGDTLRLTAGDNGLVLGAR